jgi:hypothetical protein
MTSTDMQIEHNDNSNQTVTPPLGTRSSITRNDRKITVEDSVETISDLIAECRLSISPGCDPVMGDNRAKQ